MFKMIVKTISYLKKACLVERLLFYGMQSVTQVQIMKKAVCISLYTNLFVHL